MIRFFTMAFMAAFIITTSPSYAAPEVGQPAPAFTGTDINGAQISLNDYLGKIVVLEWTNHECPYVQKHYDTNNMQSLQEEATAKDIIWLTIASSAPKRQGHTTAEEAKAVIEQVSSHETTRILDPEGTIGGLYDARTTPHMFVINPEGVLVYMGAIDDNPSSKPETVKGSKNFVRTALNALENGTPPAQPSTQPYGCSVKYKVF